MVRKRSISAFSLVELLLVLTLVGILLAFTAPSLLTLKSASLSTAGREFGAFLNLCRSEAIANHNAYRLGVVVESTDETEIFRKYAAWKWDKKSRSYDQESNWNILPTNIVFDETEPQYVKDSVYANEERSSVRGDYILTEGLSNDFEEEGSGDITRTIRFLQFSPSGRASLPGGEKRNAIFVIREVDVEKENVKNWVQFTVDTLTGRSRIYRP